MSKDRDLREIGAELRAFVSKEEDKRADEEKVRKQEQKNQRKEQQQRSQIVEKNFAVLKVAVPEFLQTLDQEVFGSRGKVGEWEEKVVEHAESEPVSTMQDDGDYLIHVTDRYQEITYDFRQPISDQPCTLTVRRKLGRTVSSETREWKNEDVSDRVTIGGLRGTPGRKGRLAPQGKSYDGGQVELSREVSDPELIEDVSVRITSVAVDMFKDIPEQ